MTHADILNRLLESAMLNVEVGVAPADIAPLIILHVRDVDRDLWRPAAEGAVALAVAGHLYAQSQWVGFTDCERLDCAMSRLGCLGFLCLHADLDCDEDFDKAFDLVEERRAGGRNIPGIVYYTYDALLRAIEGEGLFINVACTVEEDVGAATQQVLSALQQQGLEAVCFPDEPNQVLLPKFVWRRRRHPNGEPLRQLY